MPGDNSHSEFTAVNDLESVSQALTTARLNAEPLPGFPGPLPTTLDEAYAVQSNSINRWPDNVGGWKVGSIAEELRVNDSADQLAGPIFASSIKRVQDGESITAPIYVGGFAAIEAEFILEIAHDVVPVAKRRSDEELRALISMVYVGAEIASSPLATINDIGPPAIISDFGNNAGLLVGPPVLDWVDRNPTETHMRVVVDDQVVGEKHGIDWSGGPLAALEFILSLSAKRGITLASGTLISTGAVTGIHNVTTGSVARLDFSGIGNFTVKFEVMQAER